MTPPPDDLDRIDPPPPEVLEEVAAAWDRASALSADGLELHIGTGRVSGRVRGELRLEDTVLLRLGPSQLVALACGDPVRVPRERR